MSQRNIHHYFTRSRKRQRTHPQQTMTDMATGPDVANIGTQAGSGTIWDAATRRKYYANRKRRRTYYNKKQRGAYYRGRRYGSGRSSTFTSDGKLTQVVGRGGYWGDAWNAFKAMGSRAKQLVPKGAFADLGAAGGAAFTGTPLGAFAGGLAGHGLSKIVGFGAYNIKENSILAKMDEGVQIPYFGDIEHATIVRHREFVFDLTAVGGATFTNITFNINPANSGLFPWLSSVAENYDQYQILGMIIEFKTTSSDITAGGALGSVIMASDYDVVDAPYATKVEMENSQYCTSEKPSCSFYHAIECAPSATFSPIKFIRRTSGLTTSQDNRLYDHANFQLATVGLPISSGNIGELWISYEIALYKPQLGPGVLLVDHFQLDTGVSTSAYLKSTAGSGTPTTNSTLGGTIATSTYTFPPNIQRGRYMCHVTYKGAATALTTVLGISPVAGCVTRNLYEGNGVNFTRVEAAAVSTRQLGCFTIEITGQNASVIVSQGTLPTSITSGDLWIMSLAPNQN